MSSEDDQDRWKTEDQAQKNQGNYLRGMADNRDNDCTTLACINIKVYKFALTDVESEGNGRWEDQSTNQVDEHDELHAEAKCTAQVSY